MKRVISIIFLLCALPITGHASFEHILSHELAEDPNIFFAYEAVFESGERLITVSAEETSINIRISDNEDGGATDDDLNITTGGGNIYKLSLISDSEFEYLMLETNSVTECFTLIDDKLMRRTVPGEYKTVTDIISDRNGKRDTFGNTNGGAYNLLNQIKKRRSYSFINRINSMDSSKLYDMRRTIAACADIMKYDCKNYDFDRLMKYILNTNANFKILSSISPMEHGDEIRLVNEEYIDDVVKNVFGLEPQHPYVNELVTRGYCADNSFYRYVPAFNVSYCTEICDFDRVYDIGNNIYYVIFGDVYTEKTRSIPEYSYAVLEETDRGYKLLRIDMGGELLDENEVMTYAGVKKYEKFSWEHEKTKNNFLAKLKKVWYTILVFFGRDR